MPIANSTGNEQQPTVELLPCSSDSTAGLHLYLTFISVLNSFLSFTVFLGNAVILIALHKQSSLHPPSKLLLRCLAKTDLCVGLVTEPLIITKWMSMVDEHWNICVYVEAVSLRISFFFGWSVPVNSDCNKRGQTSRSVVFYFSYLFSRPFSCEEDRQILFVQFIRKQF